MTLAAHAVHSEGMSAFVRDVVRAASRPATCDMCLCEYLLRLECLPPLPLRDARGIVRVFSAVLTLCAQGPPELQAFCHPSLSHRGGSCTCTMRINLTGSPLDCHKSKKA